MSTLYRAGQLLVAPLLRAVWRPAVSGTENVPRTGPVILASNHLSVIDSILLPTVIHRQIYFLAKDEYFRRPLKRALMRGLNQIPVSRSGGRASLMALDEAVPVLRSGNALGIYPEGTRSADGRLYRGRPGVAKLALDTGATLVPVGLLDTDKLQPIGTRLPKIGPRVEVRIGTPVDLTPWRERAVDSRVLREITAHLMERIRELTGQEYVGRYAPRRDA